MRSFLQVFVLSFLLISVITVNAQQLKPPVKPGIQQNNQSMEKEGPLWKKADSLSNQGLPQSALAVVAEILKQSEKESNYSQYIKANLYELKLRSQFEENYLENFINEREQLLKHDHKDRFIAAQPVNQIIHSIVADLYWQYYSQNRYLILDRTIKGGAESLEAASPVSTWDVAMFINKVSEHYKASLDNEKLLQSISLKEYDPILEKAEDSKIFRPTLFDFLAHRAADFFMNEEASITKPVEEYVMKDPLLLSSAQTFIKLPLSGVDSLSFQLQALKLLQSIITFHLNDADAQALVDADLERLEYVFLHINNDRKDSLYYAALDDMVKLYKDKPVSAAVMEQIAQWYYSGQEGPVARVISSESQQREPDYVKAREWCLLCINKFPETKAATNCRNLLKEIELPYLEFISYSEATPKERFPLLLKYKNVKQVWMQLVKTDYIADREYYGDREKLLKKLLKKKSFKSWSERIPDNGDYKQHMAELIMPEIEPGKYILMMTNRESFSNKDSIIVFGFIQISNISYISRNAPDGSGLVYALNRKDGKPLKGVDVQSYTVDYDYQARNFNKKSRERYVTGNDGSFSIKAPNAHRNANLSFEFRYKGDTLITENYYALYNRAQYAQTEQRINTFFFTDRSIYRPGQPLYFKGIVVRSDGDSNEIVEGNNSTVDLYNVNGVKISSTTVTSNKFGSFSGNFILPASGLTGPMRISNETGGVSFTVEEYKRPRFEVTFKPIDSTYRLNEEVKITGQAKTYSDVALTGAAVKYRVVRTAIFPFYRVFTKMLPPFHIPDAEIANGSTTTGNDGTFNISFTATPDSKDYGDQYPLYTFMIYADVTDINGETHSGLSSVSISKKALLLETDIPDYINSNDWKFTVKATNLSGRKVSADVKIEVYKLKQGELLVPRKWDTPDTSLYSFEQFRSMLPHFPYMYEEQFTETVKEKNSGIIKLREKLIYTANINTAKDSIVFLKDIKPEPGRYLLTLTANDKWGTPVTMEQELVIFDPDSQKIPAPQYLWFMPMNKQPKQGEKLKFLAGSSVSGRLLIEIEHTSNILMHKWYDLADQKQFEYQLPDSLTGQVSVLATLVYENNNFTEQFDYSIKDSSKELKVVFETFRSLLLPGGTEKWKLRITDPDNKPLEAELLASMYDASLDAFTDHTWNFSLFQSGYRNFNWELAQSFNTTGSLSLPRQYYGGPVFIQLYDQLNWFGYNSFNYRNGGLRYSKAGAVEEEVAAYIPGIAVTSDAISKEKVAPSPIEPKPAPVQIRRNFNETAFFYPQLTTNKEGEIWVEFTVPEALTKWNFMGLAHTKTLRNGQFKKEIITRKELMVNPNLPRFFREGDSMTIQTKISNITPNPMQGKALLEILNAMTMQPVDNEFTNKEASKQFDITPNGNTTINWKITVPSNISAVIVRITAQAGNHSDGEEVMLPVLINRMLVTETLPLPLSSNKTKTFKFTGVLNEVNSTLSKNTSTLTPHRLTLEFTSNPAWYAVQALPWLNEKENENSDQIFNRFYANSIAGFIANSSPKIKNVFESWKSISPDALLSNLEKNAELKALVVEETPWLMDAKDESEQKQRLALLFDLNRIAAQNSVALSDLAEKQTVNGGWPWFEGMPESRYITQLIVTGMGKLNYLKVLDLKKDDESSQIVRKAVNFLTDKIIEDYNRILKDSANIKRIDPNKKVSKDYLNSDHLDYQQIQFLYALSYLKDIAQPSEKAKDAIAYFSGQARKYWNTRSLYAQAMIGIWAGRSGDSKTTQSIMNSLRERSITNEEMGTYWKDNRPGYYWYQAPVETQSIIIELFEEFAATGDAKTTGLNEVDQMKTWLLKQKQTQSWPTTTATAEAVYALLLRGTDWLQTEQKVKINIGSKVLDIPSKDIKTEPGTGYFKTSWSGKEIVSQMADITITKSDNTPAWGALYFQYFENLDKIKAADSPLKINKQLFIKENTQAGQRLLAITPEKKIQIGDQIVVRIEIIVDRDLEYVHLKDLRASAFEPVNVLSGYQWRSGLGYYESTRDASTDFFFNYLPKGTHVFEYSLTASQSGEYSNGISTIQCMYAPEFAAHSKGIRVHVK
jgi:hypothetical protein